MYADYPTSENLVSKSGPEEMNPQDHLSLETLSTPMKEIQLASLYGKTFLLFCNIQYIDRYCR